MCKELNLIQEGSGKRNLGGWKGDLLARGILSEAVWQRYNEI